MAKTKVNNGKREPPLRSRLAERAVYAVCGALFVWITPFWPVAPVFDPAGPTLGSPFDVPFAVKNASKAFAIKGLRIVCEIESVKTLRNVEIRNTKIAFGDNNVIGRDDQALYVCPFKRAFGFHPEDAIAEATIRFRYRYRQSLLGWDTEMSERVTPIFTLSNRVIPFSWETRERLQ